MIVLLVALALVGGAGFGATLALRPMFAGLTESNDYTGSGSGAVSVVVHSGDSGRTIGAALEKVKVVKSAKAFADAAKADPRSGSIQPGTYALRASMSAASALAMLLDPANRTVPKVTIKEGLWVPEIVSILAASTGQPVADYEAALKDAEALGLPAAAKGNAQGYLFPATYGFEKDASAAEQLHIMVAKCLDQLAALGVDAGRTHRVLTIASIVEAEARSSTDRPKVARVIENRLKIPMKLQLDSTVSFAVQKRGRVATSDDERASKSPYNTYQVAGLPPGPINSPGKAAMQAAIAPTPGPWIFFVAVNPDTGETRFAVNAKGHAANEKLFVQWCNANKARC